MTVSGHTEHAMGNQKEFRQEHIDFLEVLYVQVTVHRDKLRIKQPTRSVIPNRGSAVPWGTANTS